MVQRIAELSRYSFSPNTTGNGYVLSESFGMLRGRPIMSNILFDSAEQAQRYTTSLGKNARRLSRVGTGFLISGLGLAGVVGLSSLHPFHETIGLLNLLQSQPQWAQVAESVSGIAIEIGGLGAIIGGLGQKHTAEGESAAINQYLRRTQA